MDLTENTSKIDNDLVVDEIDVEAKPLEQKTVSRKKRATAREKELELELQSMREQLENAYNILDSQNKTLPPESIDSINKSWQKKQARLEEQYKATVAQKEQAITSLLVDKEAEKIASEISTSPSLLQPIIQKRLMADFTGEKPTTRVLDENGEISSMTIDELKQEIIANKEFSAIIIGSKASGSRQAGENQHGMRQIQYPTQQTNGLKGLYPGEVRLSSASHAEIVRYMKSKNEN